MVSYDRSQYLDTRCPIPVLTSEVTSGLSRTRRSNSKKSRTEHLDVEFLEIQVDIFHTSEGHPSPWILTSNYTKTTGVTQSNPCRQQPLDLRPLGHRSVAMSHPRQGGRMFGVSLGLINGFELVQSPVELFHTEGSL